jgi:hypothetical protein
VPDALPARKDPYRDRNVIAMFALAVALLSIPGTLVSVVVGLPPFVDYLVGGAPIAIACFALLASFRLGHGVRMSLIALAFSVITMGAGFAASAQPAVADLHDAPIQVPGLSELQDLSTELP